MWEKAKNGKKKCFLPLFLRVPPEEERERERESLQVDLSDESGHTSSSSLVSQSVAPHIKNRLSFPVKTIQFEKKRADRHTGKKK